MLPTAELVSCLAYHGLLFLFVLYLAFLRLLLLCLCIRDWLLCVKPTPHRLDLLLIGITVGAVRAMFSSSSHPVQASNSET